MVACISATSARAQVCGDADGSGTVTVTDGVQALRSAAGLSSNCTIARCDVDSSGTITVTDGVNILRKAAGLSSADNCTFVDQDAQAVAFQVQPFLSVGLLFIRAAQIPTCANGSDGAIELSGDTYSIDTCQLGQVEYDGTITVGSTTASFDLSAEFLLADESLDIFGDLSIRDNATSVTLNGVLELSSTLSGDYGATFNEVTFARNAQGQIVLLSGTLTISESIDDTDLGGVDHLTITFDGTGIAHVDVVLDDGRQESFGFNLATGALT